jgi:hypothetical protein
MAGDIDTLTVLHVSGTGNDDDLLAELERRALMGLSDEDEAGGDFDLAARIRGEADGPAVVGDDTLGGYIDKHNRVPAFTGCDEQPYTVDLDVEETGDPAQPCAAFLVFVRWAATGAGIMDHVESGTVATGPDAETARRAALDLSLYEVKAELDAAIDRKRRELED